ncbi:hypothetical protein [Nonomuraea recticatena]
MFGFDGPLPWWRRAARIPVGVLKVLHRRRGITPTPIAYLLPALAATMVGLVAQWLWGWSWWLFPLTVVAGLWLLYLSSEFRRQWASRPLRHELLDVIAPGGSVRRHQEEEELAFRTAPFPLYGLPPAWPGQRWTAERSESWSAGEPARLELVLGHGHPEDGPQLTVAVTDQPSDAFQVRQAVEELWEVTRRDGGEQPDPAWAQVTILIDGEQQTFAYLADGLAWLARAELPDDTVTVRGREWPVETVELVRVQALEPYFAGRQQLDAAHRSASS